jgi:hypothetical protein
MVDYFEAKIGIGEAAHRNPVGVRERLNKGLAHGEME